MVLNMTTQAFSRLNSRELKKVLGEYLGHKVNEIVYGGMTNDTWGLYRVRHNECAYSKIKVDPTDSGLTELTIYNYQTKEWQSVPSGI